MCIVCNAKLKRRFGQTEGHDQRQVTEASGSYKVQQPKMADLSVVTTRLLFLASLKSGYRFLQLYFHLHKNLPKMSVELVCNFF